VGGSAVADWRVWDTRSVVVVVVVVVVVMNIIDRNRACDRGGTGWRMLGRLELAAFYGARGRSFFVTI